MKSVMSEKASHIGRTKSYHISYISYVGIGPVQ